MWTPRLPSVAPAVLAAAALLAACGGDSEVAKEDYVDAATEAILASDSDFEFEEDNAECIAEAVVDGLGVDALNEAGISADELRATDTIGELEGLDVDDDVKADLSDGIQDCGLDFGSQLADEFTAEIGADVLSGESLECITTEISNSPLIADALVEAIVEGDAAGGEEAGEQAAIEAFGECPESLTDLFVAGVEQQGADVSDEARACLQEQVEANIDVVVDAIVAQSGGDEIGQVIVEPCASELGL